MGSVHEKFARLSREASRSSLGARRQSVMETKSVAKLAQGTDAQTSNGALDRQQREPVTDGILDGMQLEDVQSKFDADGETVRLDKRNVIELVKWILRKSDRVDKITEILGLFEKSLEGDLSYDEFVLLYEEITTRVELKAFFHETLSQMNLSHSGSIPKEKLMPITDHMLHHFARIWCSKSEIVEIKTRLNSLFATFENKFVNYTSLLEIYDSMLVSIRLIHMTRAKIKTFDTNNDGRLDKGERQQLVDWILQSYHRNGIVLSEDKREQLLRFDDEEDLNVGQLRGVRELSTLFELIKENRNCFHALNAFMLNEAFPFETLSSEELNEDDHQCDNHVNIANEDIYNKFSFLDIENTGKLSRERIEELLEWIFVGSPKCLRIFQREFNREVQSESVVSFITVVLSR